MDENLIKARMLYYAFFSEVFNFLESKKAYEDIALKLERLSEAPINEDAKKALDAMREFLKQGYEALKEEQNEVFYSPVTSFVPMSASFYDEKRDDGKKRIKMISLMKQAGFVKDESFKDSEDHVGFIYAFMFTLLSSLKAQDIELSKEVFKDILNPFADEFTQRIYIHEKSGFYKYVAVLLDVFMKLERLNYGIK